MKYKEEQRKTREALKPRQVEVIPGGHLVSRGARIVQVNRKEARQRFTNREGSQPDYSPVINDYRLQREKPRGTNHERHKARRGVI